MFALFFLFWPFIYLLLPLLLFILLESCAAIGVAWKSIFLLFAQLFVVIPEAALA